MNIRVDEKIISKIEINDVTGSSQRQNYLTYRFYAMVKRKLNASNDQITKIMGQGSEKIKAPNTQYSDLMQHQKRHMKTLVNEKSQKTQSRSILCPCPVQNIRLQARRAN